MISNYFKIALRNIVRQKGYSLINVMGLAIGIAACILIFIWVNDELSYDKYHAAADRIYRIMLKGRFNNEELNAATSPAAMAKALMEDYPEIEAAVRIDIDDNMLLTHVNHSFEESNFMWADSTIFSIFDIPLLKGDAKNALNRPHQILPTASMAEKYFGAENPVGKFIKMEDGTLYEVTGVVADCPSNSHFKYNFIASFVSRGDAESPLWVSNNLYTYFVLRPGASIEHLRAKFPAMVEKYAGPQIERATGVTFKDFLESGSRYGYDAQKLSDIHLFSQLDGEVNANGDIRYVYIFSAVALFILLIACINFMNLATARSAGRAREVGVRKVLGSTRQLIVRQFLAESIITTFIALIFSILIVEILLPYFNELAGKELSISYFMNPWVLPALAGLLLAVGVIAGSYPALYLSGFQPARVLKGKLKGNSSTAGLRSGLVLFQFAISIFLFISMFVVKNQLDFIYHAKLGYNKDHLVVIERAWSLRGQKETFKNNIKRHPNIIDAAGINRLPGSPGSNNSVHEVEGQSSIENHLLWTISGDDDLCRTLQLNIKSGRDFNPAFGADTLSALLNESAVALMKLDDPFSKNIIRLAPTPDLNRAVRPVGVVEDFHFQPLHEKIHPLVVYLDRGDIRHVMVRVRPEAMEESIALLEAEWKKIVPDKPFSFHFYDDFYDDLYKAENRTGKLFMTFAILAIFIASLGLFGLSSYTAEQRTKEIGIRKTLGASTPNLALLLSREFTKWVIMANILAWPVAYYVMKNWLEGFAFRVNLSLSVFLWAGLIALLLALTTVSYQAVKTALSNPIKALRYE